MLICKSKIFGYQFSNPIDVMPLVYQQNINYSTKLGVWNLSEAADFFLQKVPLKTLITHPHKQLQHLAGRYLLTALYPDFPSELIQIADTKKPFLVNDAYHFSISHCGEFAAVMVSSTHRVGVDIELITKKVGLIKNKFLSNKEQSMLASLEPLQPHLPTGALLTAAWSIKESLFKWHGDGKIDFKKHLVINQIIFTEDGAIAFCSFLKGKPQALEVNFMFIKNNCLAWVVS